MSSIIPLAHAAGKPLKPGDTWTLSVSYNHYAVGWGSDLGNYNETGHYADTFTVDSNSQGILILSETKTVTWTSIGFGFFGDGQNGTNTFDYRYVINATTLNVISETGGSNSSTGHPAWMLIDPSTLVQGATVVRAWWAPSFDSTTFSSPYTVPNVVSGNETLPFKGESLNVWNLVYSGKGVGMSAIVAGTGLVYSTGKETDTTQFDHTYGIIVGLTIVGTYSGSFGTGGWTDSKSYSGQITASNLSFGSSYSYP
jgi:hypothetical protein